MVIFGDCDKRSAYVLHKTDLRRIDISELKTAYWVR